MKIVQIGYGIEGGGAFHVSLTLADSLVKKGHKVDIISVNKLNYNNIHVQNNLKKLDSINVRHFCLNRAEKSFGILSLIRLLRILKKENYDLSHSHLAVPDIYCGIIKTLFPFKFKHVSTIHNTILYHNKFLINTIFRKTTFVKCSPVIGNINSVKEEFIIPNGVNLCHYSPKLNYKTNVKGELGIEFDSILLIYVAIFRKQKNHEIAIDTILELQNKYNIQNLHLLLCGGLDFSHLVEYAKKIGIQSKIHFLGQRSDIPELLYNCDMFISTSLWEGLPLAVIEAFASGIITVISPISEHKIIGQNMDDCFFPDEISGTSFAETISSILGNKKFDDHKTILEKRKNKLSIYSLETFSNSYEKLYNSLINHNGK